MKKTILFTILILACLVLMGAGCGSGAEFIPAKNLQDVPAESGKSAESDEPAVNSEETKAMWGDGTEFNPTWKDYINPIKWFTPVFRTVPQSLKDMPERPSNQKEAIPSN